MKIEAFPLRQPGLSGFNELCIFLNGLEGDARIGSWEFGRYVGMARTGMEIGFVDPADAGPARDAWPSRR